MTALTLTSASLSRPGGHEVNEDACGLRGGCYVLADGLGGHGGGEVAAGIAVDAMLGALADAPMSAGRLAAAFVAVNAALHAHQATEARLAGMRTTLVVLLTDGAMALWGHVGDSRLYHLRGGRIVFQTEDHSVPQALVRAGELTPAGIRGHEDRNRLLRTLGNPDPPRPTLLSAPMPLLAGDTFLLASDGLWEYVTEPEMEITLAKAADPAHWLAQLALRLHARAEPGHDNYSGIAVWVG